MKCKKCGADLVEGDRFCQNCGFQINETKNNREERMDDNLASNSYSEMNSDQSNNQGFNNGINMGYSNNQGFNNGMNMGYSNNQGFNNGMNMGYSNNQGFNNGMSPYPNYNMYGNGGNKNIIIIVAVVAVALVVGIVGYFAFGKNLNNESKNNSNNVNSTNTTGDTTATSNTPTTISSDTNYKVNYGGFTFTIPGNMKYVEEDGMLMFSNQAETVGAYFVITEGNIELLKSQKEMIISYFEEQGVSASNVQVKKYNDVEFITVEVSSAGVTQLCCYAKLNETVSAAFQIVSVSGKADYTFLNDLATIVKSAVYNSSANSMNGLKFKSMVNFKDIEKMVK